jgi:hypothetical protein
MYIPKAHCHQSDLLLMWLTTHHWIALDLQAEPCGKVTGKVSRLLASGTDKVKEPSHCTNQAASRYPPQTPEAYKGLASLPAGKHRETAQGNDQVKLLLTGYGQLSWEMLLSASLRPTS